MLLKLFYKLTNSQKYQNYKIKKRITVNKDFFKDKLENYLINIQEILLKKKEINFLHSGHTGDIINILPIIKKLSETHKCNLFLQINLPAPSEYNDHPAGNVFLNERIYKMLLPLLKFQKYINKVELYNRQNIDINFDKFRELPINILFDNMRYGMHIAGIQPNLNEDFITAETNHKFKNSILLLRSLRYQNYFINYKFLDKYENTYYIGVRDEYEQLKKEINNLKFYDCKDFLEMASIIKSSKIFIGNSSLGFDIAEGLKIPRLLEASPDFPARQVHGKNGFDFYFQTHFEKYFKFFMEK